MNSITNIHIENFRRLDDIQLEMRPLMVLIGANGVGKSSFLDVLSILSASAAGKLNRTLSMMGGLSGNLTGGNAGEMAFSLDMDIPEFKPLKYSLTLNSSGPGYNISSEELSQERAGHAGPFKHIHSQYGHIRYYDTTTKKLIEPNWEHDSAETSLSQVPKMFKQPEDLKRLLGSATRYHALSVGDRAPVKLPQQLKPADLPGPDGEDIVPYLFSLKESYEASYEAIIDTLTVAFPRFERLNFPPVAAGMLALTWKDKDFEKPLYMNQLSEGTLRFLWLVSLLHSPGLSTITMIDEPEVSLHPELLSLFADLMREAACRTQLIVATHSDRLVRFLKPDEVVVMDIDEGGHCSATWADSLNLDSWLEEYSLDEVWRRGRMGGRA